DQALREKVMTEAHSSPFTVHPAPFELLYGRNCRVPICWDEVGERLIEGLELIEITNEKVAVAKEK
nr:putative reverse transcriptase domain-containing protein [Tanacetum cinerariifolium]